MVLDASHLQSTTTADDTKKKNFFACVHANPIHTQSILDPIYRCVSYIKQVSAIYIHIYRRFCIIFFFVCIAIFSEHIRIGLISILHADYTDTDPHNHKIFCRRISTSLWVLDWGTSSANTHRFRRHIIIYVCVCLYGCICVCTCGEKRIASAWSRIIDKARTE